MTPHSSTLAWRIPGTGEPGGLPSVGSHRVGHNWSELAAAAAAAWNLERWERWPYMWDSKRDTDIKNRLLDSVGESKGGMIWENSIETCILSYVNIICEIDRQSRFNAWDRMLRASTLGWPWGMAWGGKWEGGSGWGTYVHPCVLIHVNAWQKPPQYCKVISLQLKLKNK